MTENPSFIYKAEHEIIVCFDLVAFDVTWPLFWLLSVLLVDRLLLSSGPLWLDTHANEE